MIKWIVCLIWGHDLDIQNTRKLELFLRPRDITPTIIRPQAFCKRCQKYRTV
jgi:hypothetical protein